MHQSSLYYNHLEVWRTIRLFRFYIESFIRQIMSVYLGKPQTAISRCRSM